MAAINFPDSPTPGQLFTVGDITWQWDVTDGLWRSLTIGTHATSHEDGGSDEVLLAQSQITNLTTDLAGKVDEVDGAVTTASTSATVVRNITLSTSDPTGGSDGDVWLKYTA